MSAPTDDDTRELARTQYEDEGTLEIDPGATVSRAEDNEDEGAYVQVWVWVADPEEGE